MDVARTLGLNVEDRNELGGWSLPKSVRGEVSSRGDTKPKIMANAYSEGSAALHREFTVRSALLAVVRDLVGTPSGWQERVPLQRGELPSFDFLQSVANVETARLRGLHLHDGVQ